jgi:hypothetical protein
MGYIDPNHIDNYAYEEEGGGGITKQDSVTNSHCVPIHSEINRKGRSESFCWSWSVAANSSSYGREGDDGEDEAVQDLGYGMGDDKYVVEKNVDQ